MKPHYNRPTNDPIERMKNQWAAAEMSPFQFYVEFYRHCSHQTYVEFLEMINFHERYSPALKKACADFRGKFGFGC